MLNLNPKIVADALREPVALLLAKKVVAECERERVDKIQRDVLAKSEFTGIHLQKNGEGQSFRVLEPKDTWLLTDDDAKRYYEILKQIHLNEGYEDAARGFCPALSAEYEQLKAEWALIEKAQTFFPQVTNSKLLAAGGVEQRKKYLDMLIGLTLAADKL